MSFSKCLLLLTVFFGVFVLNYGKEFAKAIEEKQVAFQDAERQKFVVQRVEQEKMATITKAEGEAQAAELISNALLKSGQGSRKFYFDQLTVSKFE